MVSVLKNGLVKGKWYLVEVGQYFSEGEYIYYIKINDQIVKQMVNNKPTEFNDFVVYAGNPWTRNGFLFRRLIIYGIRFVFTISISLFSDHLN